MSGGNYSKGSIQLTQRVYFQASATTPPNPFEPENQGAGAKPAVGPPRFPFQPPAAGSPTPPPFPFDTTTVPSSNPFAGFDKLPTAPKLPPPPAGQVPKLPPPPAGQVPVMF